MEKKELNDFELEAIEIVKGEVTKYKDGEWFITERVALAVRVLIRLLRKNYWGVFDEKIDPTTGREKRWIPLTRLIVDSTRKLSDIDLRDLTFAALRKKARGIIALVRGYVRFWLRVNFFGEVLDESILQMCIDGTVVWKTYSYRDGNKTIVKRKNVDILNVYIDPTADSIQEAQRFTERALMSTIEVEGMTGWHNTKDMKTAAGLHRTEPDITQPAANGDFVDVYEMWGLIPNRLLTGNKDDTGTSHGHIVISGIETGDLRVHIIEENTNKDKAGNVVKPYEEMRYLKVPGRWYGVGPAEMVLHLQEWINEIVNMRMTKNRNASLGLFKIRAGANVTQQMLTNLVSRGVIKLNDMGDLENLQINEAGEGSYRDEDVAKDWAYKVTSTYDIARGESSSGAATATASVIEDRNSKTAFTLVIESVGHMLQRWMDRQFLPHVPKLMKENKDVTVYGDFDDVDQLREQVVAYLAMNEMDRMFKETGYVPTAEEMQMAMQKAEEDLRRDKDIFFELVENIAVDSLETVAQFTNEASDPTVTVRNLLDMAGLVEDPQARNEFFMQSMDLMGLDIPESLRRGPQQPAPMPGAPGQSGPLAGLEAQMQGLMPTPPTEQGITTGALTQ